MIEIQVDRQGCSIKGTADEISDLGMWISGLADMREAGNTPSPVLIWNDEKYLKIDTIDDPFKVSGTQRG